MTRVERVVDIGERLRFDTLAGVDHQQGTLALRDGKADWEKKTYPVLVENALRQLIGVSPDMQTS
jgi:ribosomal protein S5